MAIADEVLKLSAGYIKCGAPAIHTQRRGDRTDRVQVGTVVPMRRAAAHASTQGRLGAEQ